MKLVFYLLLMFTQCDDVISGKKFEEDIPEPEKTNILFIGNSLTFYNSGLDSMLIRIVNSSDTSFNVIERLTFAGWTLKNHWNNELVTKAKIHEQEWDYIVLQESGSQITQDLDPTLAALKEFKNFINIATEAKIYLYQNWAYLDFGVTWNEIDSLYEIIDDSLNLDIVPVAKAWKTSTVDVDLFHSDRSHPSWAGTYLNSSLFFAYCFNRNPEFTSYVPSSINQEIVEQLRVHAWNIYLANESK